VAPTLETVPEHHYVGLYPWVWVEFVSTERPGPFPFLAGADPRVVAGLHEVYEHLAGALDITISDVFAGRDPPGGEAESGGRGGTALQFASGGFASGFTGWSPRKPSGGSKYRPG
jgi:hypothetical protein